MTDWGDLAACRGLTSDAFFGRNLDEAAEAIRVCDGCRVRRQCLDHAIAEEIHLGVWGGLTERQRRAYVRDHRLAS